jgi:hypothetical protein
MEKLLVLNYLNKELGREIFEPRAFSKAGARLSA